MGMNPDTNRFEMLELRAELQVAKGSLSGLLRPDGTPVPKHWSTFQIGELVVIKGYTFKVGFIGDSVLLFEPVGVPDLLDAGGT